MRRQFVLAAAVAAISMSVFWAGPAARLSEIPSPAHQRPVKTCAFHRPPMPHLESAGRCGSEGHSGKVGR